MGRLRGLLLDFYGTLVHEDDINLADITARIHSLAPSGTSASDIGQFWYTSFFAWCDRSYEGGFVSQRYLAVESLRETLIRFEVPLAPEDLIAPQLTHWTAPPIFPDAKPFLNHARRLGLSLCVVSNVDRADIELAIATHGLQFDHLVTSDDARSYKPRPEMFLMALESLGLSTGDVLLVGDSWSSDVRGAQAMGMRVAWLNRRGRIRGACPNPDWEIASLADLWHIIDELAR